MNKYDLLIYGIILALIYSENFLPKKEGNSYTKSFTLYPIFFQGKILISINENKVFHIHHWLIFFIISLSVKNYFLFGFSIFMTFQGLIYRDCFKFIENKPKNYL